MFPVRNDRPSGLFPLVVLLLIAANIYVFFLELKLGPKALEFFSLTYGLVPARDWPNPTSVSFLTSMFLHGGIFHILSNLWVLWLFGGNVEGAMGHLRFLIFYIVCGILAGATHAYLNPESTMPVVGASGAIAGVMGSYLLLFPRSKIKMFTLLIFYPLFFELPALIFLVIWFVGQLLGGTADYAARAALETQEAAGIAFFAHVGGFLAGVLLTPVFKRAASSARV